jgi:cell division protease FtsH
MFQSQNQIKGNIQVLLAGRAAEEIIFGTGEITTGASNDIQKASSLVVDYINKFGMDPDMGLFSTQALESGQDGQLTSKCRNMMNDLYAETKKLLEKNITLLENVTKELLERESLNGEDINQICA